MAVNDGNSDNLAKKRRNIPKREWAKREIRRLLINESMTVSQISEHLNLPKRSVERYIAAIYESDNEILQRPSAEEMAICAAILLKRLALQRQLLLRDVIMNPNVSASDKIEAHHLLGELSRIPWVMSHQTPAQLCRHLGFSPRDNRLISEDSRGLMNLKLVKPTNNNNDNDNQLTINQEAKTSE